MRFFLLLFMCPLFAFASTLRSDSMATAFKKIKQHPQILRLFIADMPKGGDLHNHLWGATYPELLIQYPNNNEFCLDPDRFIVTQNTYCPNEIALKKVVDNPELYAQLIEHWSFENFIKTPKQTAYQHFFSIFGKNAPLVMKYRGDMLAEVSHRASLERVHYLELMITHGNSMVRELAHGLKWEKDFPKMTEQLLKKGMREHVADIGQRINNDENIKDQRLNCTTSSPKPGCELTVRYQYLAIRTFPPEQVFAQLLAGFLLASEHSKVVAINIVGPEVNPIALQDYTLHMEMIGYLHTRYPSVNISLHAGEISPTQTPPELVNYHIYEALHIAKAQRIGHGVNIVREQKALETLTMMAEKKILVEINLTSNDKILGVKAPNHPLSVYLARGVPVALSTDDEGILRTSINKEYQLAASEFPIDYLTLKQMNRNSLTYSFVEGKSVWANPEETIPVEACARDEPDATELTPTCREWLKKNKKATLQWQLERRLVAFEKRWNAGLTPKR